MAKTSLTAKRLTAAPVAAPAAPVVANPAPAAPVVAAGQPAPAMAAAPPSLPAIFAPAGQGGSLDIIQPPGESVPYITFASTRSPNWAKLAAAIPGLKEGDQVLVLPGNDAPIQCTPLKYSLVAAYQYWTQNDGQGVPIAATRVARGLPSENMDAVIIVYGDDAICPARIQFRTTKCPAGLNMSAMLMQAGDAEAFGAISPAHKLAAQIPYPWARFFGRLSLVNKIGKTNNLPYQLATVQIQPTTAVEWKLIGDFMADAENLESLSKVADAYARRVAYIESLCNKPLV